MQYLPLFISSITLTVMILGLIQRRWVQLEGLPAWQSFFSSPWKICVYTNCTKSNPEDENKIRNLMTLSLSLSIILSFLLGMDYTNMIPAMKGRYFIFAFLNFLTGICVFTSIILYFQELRKSFNVFYYNIKVTWITHSAYITIFLYIVGGIICLLSYRESNKSSQDLEDSPIQSPLTQSENIQIKTDARENKGSFPEETPIENFNRTSLSSTSKLRRVTWAFQILGQL